MIHEFSGKQSFTIPTVTILVGGIFPISSLRLFNIVLPTLAMAHGPFSLLIYRTQKL